MIDPLICEHVHISHAFQDISESAEGIEVGARSVKVIVLARMLRRLQQSQCMDADPETRLNPRIAVRNAACCATLPMATTVPLVTLSRGGDGAVLVTREILKAARASQSASRRSARMLELPIFEQLFARRKRVCST